MRGVCSTVSTKKIIVCSEPTALKTFFAPHLTTHSQYRLELDAIGTQAGALNFETCRAAEVGCVSSPDQNFLTQRLRAGFCPLGMILQTIAPGARVPGKGGAFPKRSE